MSNGRTYGDKFISLLHWCQWSKLLPPFICRPNFSLSNKKYYFFRKQKVPFRNIYVEYFQQTWTSLEIIASGFSRNCHSLSSLSLSSPPSHPSRHYRACLAALFPPQPTRLMWFTCRNGRRLENVNCRKCSGRILTACLLARQKRIFRRHSRAAAAAESSGNGNESLGTILRRKETFLSVMEVHLIGGMHENICLKVLR